MTRMAGPDRKEFFIYKKQSSRHSSSECHLLGSGAIYRVTLASLLHARSTMHALSHAAGASSSVISKARVTDGTTGMSEVPDS